MSSQIISDIVQDIVVDACEQKNHQPKKLEEATERFSQASTNESNNHSEFKVADIFSDLEPQPAVIPEVMYADAYAQTSQSLHFLKKSDCWVQTSQSLEVPIPGTKQEIVVENELTVTVALDGRSHSSLDQVVPDSVVDFGVQNPFMKQKIRRVGLSKRAKAQTLHCKRE